MKGGSGSNYQNLYERAFDGKIDPEPILRGIGSKEAALRAHRAAHKFDAKTEHKEQIAEILRQYK